MKTTPPLLRPRAVLISLAALGAAAPCWGEPPTRTSSLEPPVSSAAPVVTGPVVPPVSEQDHAAARPQGRNRSAAAPVRCRCRQPRRRPRATTRPFGASSRALFGAQVARGQAATLVLYRYDFVPGEASLAPAGKRKLARLLPRLALTPYPLIIQPSGTAAGLDQARRRVVAQALAETSPPVAAERVLVAPPPTRGLRAEQTEMLYQRWRALSGGDGGPEGALPPAVP